MTEIVYKNSVIMWDSLGRGGYWKLTDHDDGTVSFQNTADTNFKDWYLDIDGETGDVIMWDSLGRGGYWKLTNLDDGTVSLQNTAETEFENWYLDIDGKTGDVILWERLGNGGHWKQTSHPNGTVSFQNNANTGFKEWYLDIDGNLLPSPPPVDGKGQFIDSGQFNLEMIKIEYEVYEFEIIVTTYVFGIKSRVDKLTRNSRGFEYKYDDRINVVKVNVWVLDNGLFVSAEHRVGGKVTWKSGERKIASWDKLNI